MTKSKKALYGLVGFPVKHSFSPAMHNAAFNACGISAEYKLFEVEPAKLDGFLKNLKALRISGCNVTVPHKIKAYNFISKQGSLTDNAQKIGAVNTVLLKDSKLVGENTDGRGFIESLAKDLSFDYKGKTITVLGAGGAARAVVMQLGSLAKKIYLIDIDQNLVKALERDYKQYYSDQKIEGRIIKDKTQKTKLIRASDLLINATPVGMKDLPGCPVEKEALHDNLTVFDAIYNPKQTQLLNWADQKGLKNTNGFGMLLYQGVLSFEFWTNQKAPVKVMKEALKEELDKRC